MEIAVNLLTGRTIAQGQAIEYKDTVVYTKANGICELDAKDMARLGIKEGDTVEIETAYGKVCVEARKAGHEQEGIAFIPLGIWANEVIGEDTNSAGMPTYKGVKAKIRAAKEKKVLNYKEIIETSFKKEPQKV